MKHKYAYHIYIRQKDSLVERVQMTTHDPAKALRFLSLFDTDNMTADMLVTVSPGRMYSVFGDQMYTLLTSHI